MKLFFFVFIFIIFFSFIFDRLTRGYINPYKTYMLFGKKGSGKTTLIAKYAIKFIKQGKTVYSNVDVPGVIYINPGQFVGKYKPVENSVMLIDEIGMIWDKRDFSKFDKDVRDFFKYARQYKQTVYMFSQTYDDVDKKIRDLTDELYIIHRFARVFSIARRVVKVQDIGHNQEGNGTIIDDYRYCSIIDCLFFNGWEWTFIPRWVEYFNSYNPKPLPTLERSALLMTDKQFRHMFDKLWFVDAFKSVFDTVKCKAWRFSEKILSVLYRRKDNL